MSYYYSKSNLILTYKKNNNSMGIIYIKYNKYFNQSYKDSIFYLFQLQVAINLLYSFARKATNSLLIIDSSVLFHFADNCT